MPATRNQYRGAEKVKVRGDGSPPDLDEAQALAHAAHAAGLSEKAAGVCIAAWIMKRAELSAGARLTETLAFDLGDAKLRGLVGAALPAIGAAIDVPADVAFYDLGRDVIVDVFTTVVQAVGEAAVAAGEAPDFLPDPIMPLRKIMDEGDSIPFGGGE